MKDPHARTRYRVRVFGKGGVWLDEITLAINADTMQRLVNAFNEAGLLVAGAVDNPGVEVAEYQGLHETWAGVEPA